MRAMESWKMEGMDTLIQKSVYYFQNLLNQEMIGQMTFEIKVYSN